MGLLADESAVLGDVAVVGVILNATQSAKVVLRRAIVSAVGLATFEDTAIIRISNYTAQHAFAPRRYLRSMVEGTAVSRLEFELRVPFTVATRAELQLVKATSNGLLAEAMREYGEKGVQRVYAISMPVVRNPPTTAAPSPLGDPRTDEGLSATGIVVVVAAAMTVAALAMLATLRIVPRDFCCLSRTASAPPLVVKPKDLILAVEGQEKPSTPETDVAPLAIGYKDNDGAKTPSSMALVASSLAGKVKVTPAAQSPLNKPRVKRHVEHAVASSKPRPAIAPPTTMADAILMRWQYDAKRARTDARFSDD